MYLISENSVKFWLAQHRTNFNSLYVLWVSLNFSRPNLSGHHWLHGWRLHRSGRGRDDWLRCRSQLTDVRAPLNQRDGSILVLLCGHHRRRYVRLPSNRRSRRRPYDGKVVMHYVRDRPRPRECSAVTESSHRLALRNQRMHEHHPLISPSYLLTRVNPTNPRTRGWILNGIFSFCLVEYY